VKSARLQREETNSKALTNPNRARRALVGDRARWPLTFNDPRSPALRLQNSSGAGGSLILQTRLAVNQPGDKYEQEADRVAEQVMRMPDPAVRLQRKCGCGGSAASGGSCEECTRPPVQLQRRAIPIQNSSATTAPSIVDDVLRSSGQALDHSTRTFFEHRFQQDFSQVRIHADARAAESAQAVNALAYTVGSNLVFGTGRYAPSTTTGKHLLAHELAHVVQQGQSGALPGRARSMDSENHPHSHEAKRISQTARSDNKPALRNLSRVSAAVQRTCYQPPLPAVAGCAPLEGDMIGEHFLFVRGCDDFRTDTRRPVVRNRPRGEEGALIGFADTVNQGDTLEIHGFASEEGPADYNEHLSCSRAIKAMAVITGALTARGVSASVHLFKHGATASASTALRPERRSVVIDKLPLAPPRPCSTAAPVCPIGAGGAPNLRNPHIPSGSECRGACGANCPPTCTPVPDVTVCVPDATGGCHYTCTYTGVLDCGSHRGCRDHDDCYDAVAAAGETSIYGPLHRGCDMTCIDHFSLRQCNTWRTGGGPFDRRMRFSNAPTSAGPLPGSCTP